MTWAPTFCRRNEADIATRDSIDDRIANAPLPAGRPALPAARRAARILAMQTLYEHDLTGIDAAQALDAHLEFDPVDGRTESFARRLVNGAVTHASTIDDVLRETAPSWPMEAMPEVDKAILRLALFELIVDNKAPFRAVINEAVELAKAFGGEHSGRFVNGVLGTVASQFHSPTATQHKG